MSRMEIWFNEIRVTLVSGNGQFFVPRIGEQVFVKGYGYAKVAMVSYEYLDITGVIVRVDLKPIK